MNAKKWEDAMIDEVKSLEDNQTYRLMALPAERKAISGKWVYKVKRDENGAVTRFKARWVVRGFTQIEGLDYFRTYAPTVTHLSIRLLLKIAVERGLRLYQMDVKTAFLNGEITEEIYVTQPTGFTDGTSNVCRLQKGLYGLKQSPRIWSITLNKYMNSHGFERGQTDWCVFKKYVDNDWIYMLIYVDDIIIAAKTQEGVDYVRKLMKDRFKMTDVGPLRYCLGMKIEWEGNDCILVSQTNYIERLLAKFNLEAAHPLNSPLLKNMRLTRQMSCQNEEDIEFMKDKNYRSGVGALMYLMTCTRMDIAYSVSELSKFLDKAGPRHWDALINTMRYLKKTIDYKLVVRKTNDFDMKVYTDSDYAGDEDTRVSTSGFVVMCGNVPISWKSRRQSIVCTSSSEAEYVAANMAAKELLYAKKISDDFAIEQKLPMTLYEDNKSCIAMTQREGFKSRSKHIDVRFHYIRHLVSENVIDVQYCNTIES